MNGTPSTLAEFPELMGEDASPGGAGATAKPPAYTPAELSAAEQRIDAKIGELQRQEAGRAAPGEGGAGVDEVSAVLDEFVKAGGSVVDGQTMEVN